VTRTGCSAFRGAELGWRMCCDVPFDCSLAAWYGKGGCEANGGIGAQLPSELNPQSLPHLSRSLRCVLTLTDRRLSWIKRYSMYWRDCDGSAPKAPDCLCGEGAVVAVCHHPLEPRDWVVVPPNRSSPDVNPMMLPNVYSPIVLHWRGVPDTIKHLA